jgi:hypothetical protein
LEIWASEPQNFRTSELRNFRDSYILRHTNQVFRNFRTLGKNLFEKFQHFSSLKGEL